MVGTNLSLVRQKRKFNTVCDGNFFRFKTVSISHYSPPDIKVPSFNVSLDRNVGKHHAHTCSAFARLRLGSCCGAHKWYQYPRVTRIGHLKANVPASDWLGHDLRPPREITGEMICSTYVK
jgi:hypothetical protein